MQQSVASVTFAPIQERTFYIEKLEKASGGIIRTATREPFLMKLRHFCPASLLPCTLDDSVILLTFRVPVVSCFWRFLVVSYARSFLICPAFNFGLLNQRSLVGMVSQTKHKARPRRERTLLLVRCSSLNAGHPWTEGYGLPGMTPRLLVPRC